MKTKRTLKVEAGHSQMPTHIRLKGRWLERAGFKPCTFVVVSIEPGRLTIEVSPNL